MESVGVFFFFFLLFYNSDVTMMSEGDVSDACRPSPQNQIYNSPLTNACLFGPTICSGPCRGLCSPRTIRR